MPYIDNRRKYFVLFTNKIPDIRPLRYDISFILVKFPEIRSLVKIDIVIDKVPDVKCHFDLS